MVLLGLLAQPNLHFLHINTVYEKSMPSPDRSFQCDRSALPKRSPHIIPQMGAIGMSIIGSDRL